MGQSREGHYSGSQVLAGRGQALEQIRKHIQATGEFVVVREDLRGSRLRRENDRMIFENSRRNALPYELASHYRAVFFGSARIQSGKPEYELVRDATKALVEARVIPDDRRRSNKEYAQIEIVTGGGPGIMEAANEGAHRAMLDARMESGKELVVRNHGHTLSSLNTEESANPYLHFETSHPEFSTRLVGMVDTSHAAYAAPGGIGTLLEMALIAQLHQVSHLEKIFPVLFHPTWEPVIDAWRKFMYTDRVAQDLRPFIKDGDLDHVKFTDKVDDIVSIIAGSYDVWQEEIGQHVIFLSRNRARQREREKRKGNKKS